MFQSTRPVRGATARASASRSQSTFQSTRPVRGATLNAVQYMEWLRVSIHAPRAGRDAPTL
ncbi:hypothetical protein HMPREF9162_2214 [Selenomonas sp. oral taxon 137 str. F0430]|nr:hypothetical protein HMPREF9162_2214 [Selenomonas sp. oral taxon 137 str. F0430]